MAITNNPTVNIDVDSTLAGIPGIQDTISETSIHNIDSANLGQNREIDEYLKINKDEKINESQLENLKNEFAPTTNLEVANFADKRFISKQLSDKNDSDIITDLSREIHRSYETDIKLARAINLEDEEREIADAQIRADIAKEASERARIDADLANALAQYKYDMSQHITTRELDVNGDTRLNIEVVDGDTHGGNLNVETSLVVGSTNAENGTTTSEGKVIGDVHIKHDLFVDNDTTIGNDLLVENDSHIMNDLLVDKNATIEGNLDVNGTTTLNELEVENNLTVGGNLKVEGDTDLDRTLNVDGAVTLNDVLTVEKDTTLKDDLVVNKTATIDGATQLNDTLTVEKETLLNDTLTVEDATTLNDTLSVEKETTLNNTLTVEKATQLNDTLTAEGATTLKDVLDVKKSTTLEDTLAVEKSTQLNDTLTVEKSAQLNDTLTVEKASQLNDTLTVEKATTLKDTLDVKKATILEDTLQVNKQTDIGTDQTNADLYVHGSEHVSNNLNVTGTSNLGTTNVGTLDANKDLTVNGNENLNGNLNVTGNLSVTGTSNLGTTNIGTVGSNKNLVINGNESLSGTLNVDGKTTLNNELEVLNATVLKSTLNVNGNTDLDGTLSVDGAASLKSTLNVTGKSTLGDLSASTTDLGTTTVGTSSNKKNLTVNGNESVSGTLNVTGKSTLGELSAGTTALGATTIGTSSAKKNLTVNGNETVSGTLGVTGKSTLGTVAAGATTIGTTSANKNLTVNGNEIITGNLNVNTNTDLDGTLNVDGETTLNANVKIKDDSDTQKSFSDIIGAIKNALVKDFTQSYDSTTGKLTSTLEFNNFYSGNTNRPTVNTITKTINLDLEKYILDINDVYATKTVSNGKTTYTDFDISTLTDEQIRELESPDYTGNIVRCLKVKYNTYNNANAGTEKAYVYFEINDIFRSISSKLELEINNEITARNNAISNAINNLDVASVGSNGGYIKTISESDGKISASRQAFDTTINANSTNNNAPTSKAVKTYADQAITNAINALDSSVEVPNGSYLAGILQENGVLIGVGADFETTLSEVNNAPTSAAVLAGLNTKVDKVDGKQLSSEDYTFDEKTKLAGIAAGAEVNVQSDWDQTNSNADDYIKNKPNLATVATSGSYSDLTGKPTIPAAQVNSDWNATTGVSAILNRPTLATVATSGSYTDLTSKPTLGTASAKDVPNSGNANSSQVVMGNDTRLSDSRPASDVYAWAKASAKPTYTADEVGAIASTAKGAVNGVASLNASGKVPTTQLSFESSISTASPSTTNAPTCKAIMDMLSNIQKTVTLKDASGNVLLQVKYLDLSGEGDKTYIINGSISLPTINVV